MLRFLRHNPYLVLLVAALLALSACSTATPPVPTTEEDISFNFVIDPQTDEVEVEAADSWIETQANSSPHCGKYRPLKPGLDFEVIHKKVEKWNGGYYKLTTKLKNTSPYTYKNIRVLRPHYEGEVIERLAPGDSTGLMTFYVKRNWAKRFSVAVLLKGHVLCNDAQFRKADLRVTKTASADSVEFGDWIEFKIEVKNNGPHTAHNVVLRDTLTVNGKVTLRKGETFGDFPECVEQKNGVLRCLLGDLEAGETVWFGFRAQVVPAQNEQTPTVEGGLDPEANPGVAGHILNRVVVGSSTRDPNHSNNYSVAKITVKNRGYVDLGIRKSGPAYAHVGEQVVYKIEVKNHGTKKATGIWVKDYLYYNPKHVNGFGGNSQGCEYPYPTVGGADLNDNHGSGPYQEATCKLPDLMPGQSHVLYIYATFTWPGKVHNWARVYSDNNEPAPKLGNNEDEVWTQIKHRPYVDLHVSKSDRKNEVWIGGWLNYRIVVKNNGTAVAKNVWLRDRMTKDYEVEGSQARRNNTRCHPVIDKDGVGFDCNLGNIAPGGQKVIWIKVKPYDTGVFTNHAYVYSDWEDANPDDNKAWDETIVKGKTF